MIWGGFMNDRGMVAGGSVLTICISCWMVVKKNEINLVWFFEEKNYFLNYSTNLGFSC